MSMSLTNILLQETCAERSDAFIVELGSDAAIQVPKSVNVVAHLVLDGEIVIDVPQMETGFVVRRGEYAVLLYGNDHLIRNGGADAATTMHVIGEWPTGDEPVALEVGGIRKGAEGAPAAKFVSAALRMVYNPITVQFLHAMPELLHLSQKLPALWSGTVLFTDMNQVEGACRGPGGNAFVNALMNLHLIQTLRHASEQIGKSMPLVNPTDIFQSPTFRPVAVAVRMLRLHPERHWTVAELAGELGLSRSSLAARFSAGVGIGPMEYLTKVRMERAAELLRGRPDVSLGAIGRRVGYDSTSSFVRAFKAHFGVPPKVFSTQSRAHVNVKSPAARNPAVLAERLSAG